MDKAERKEKAAVAQGSLEIAAAALSHAARVASGLLTDAEVNKTHDAIGKLQLKLRTAYDKAAS